MEKSDLKTLSTYSSHKNFSRGPEIAERTLARFEHGDWVRLRRFIFNATIDCRECEALDGFDKGIEGDRNQNLLNSSRPIGRIFSSFDSATQSLTTHVIYDKKTECNDERLVRQCAALLAVTYAAIGIDMSGAMDLGKELKSIKSAGRKGGSDSK